MMSQIIFRIFLGTAVVVATLVVGRSPAAAQEVNPKTAPAKAEPTTLLEEIARSVGDGRSDAQIKRDNTFILAIHDRQVEKAAELLKAGADPSARYIDAGAFLSAGQTGYTALLYASFNDDVAAVKLLLAHKADVNYQRQGKSALYIAASSGKDEIAKLLKGAGAEGDPKAIRLTHDLIRAACQGFKLRPGEGYPPYPGAIRAADKAPTIAEVLQQGADVNGADPEGYTPLMYAANLGLIDNVKTLLASGADPARKTKGGATAASLASGDSSVNRAGRAEVVKLLRP